MMTMKKMLAWILGVTVAVLVGAQGAARATTVWTPASCATGSFDAVTVDPAGHYLVPAHMALCEPFQARFNYAVVLFHPDGAVPLARGDQLRSYVLPSAIVDVVPLERPVPVFGLCLMRDLETRVACVRIETAADGTATSAGIAPTDRLVADPVVFFRGPIVIHPNYCASCVTMNW
jgi:hypothetical protein